MLHCAAMVLKVDYKAAVKKLKVLSLSGKVDLETFRAKIEQAFSSDTIPAKVEFSQKEYGGIKCDILSPEIYASNRLLLYIHGGSFVAGSRESWRPFCAQLASASSCRVIVPEFRLPPSYPFPAGIDDIQAVFRLLLAELEIMLQMESQEFKRRPEIVIAADGSGAGMATALVLRLTEKEMESLHTLALISPWLDISDGAEILTNRRLKDEILSSESIRTAADLYTYESNLGNIYVSPLLAGAERFRTFPPVFIQCGQKEILLEQSERLKQILDSAGVRCELDVWPDMMHYFQFADEYLSESHLAIERLGKFISRREEEKEERAERQRILRLNNIAAE